jgi:hypothetical protein
VSAKVSTTLKVLTEVREEQRLMREEQRMLREEQRLVRDEQRLLREAFEREMRAVAAVLTDVRELLKERLDLRDDMRDHERRISALERRTG